MFLTHLSDWSLFANGLVTHQQLCVKRGSQNHAMFDDECKSTASVLLKSELVHSHHINSLRFADLSLFSVFSSFYLPVCM